MPTYSFRNVSTGEVTEAAMKMAEKDQYLIDNPALESIINYTNPIGDAVRLGIRKKDNGFKEVLQRIKSANRRSDIDA